MYVLRSMKMGPNSRLSVLLKDATNYLMVIFVLLGMTVTNSSPAQKIDQDPHVCNCMPNPTSEDGGSDNKNCINGTEICAVPNMSHKRSHCYAAWRNKSGVVNIQSMGCWLDENVCYDRRSCIDTSQNPYQGVFFCCCEGNFCNQNPIYRPVPATPVKPPEGTPGPGPVLVQQSPVVNTVLYSLVPIAGIFVTVIAAFYFWRRHKMAEQDTVPSQDSTSPLDAQDTPLLDEPRPVQLIEVKARGRFGAVWKAQMINQKVAVKVFPIPDKQSFNTEKDFYNLPMVINHENILNYIGAERHGDNINMDLWLITEFHERGSLYDYLKGNPVSWHELLHISEGMMRGLSFLHEAIPGSNPLNFKPAVAHRDFKSKNVLLKTDLTACIADFGLALTFQPGHPVGDAHGQVGTRRYMAPEVLEGAINFNRDAFLRIDMYASALVLWELASRCTAIGPVEDHKLPFEEEVGSYPTLEDMQEVVVQKKLRPVFKENWLKHEGLDMYCNTIEECWDHDPEARLSAGCVEERLCELIQYATHCSLISTQSLPPHLAPTDFINSNNTTNHHNIINNMNSTSLVTTPPPATLSLSTVTTSVGDDENGLDKDIDSLDSTCVYIRTGSNDDDISGGSGVSTPPKESSI